MVPPPPTVPQTLASPPKTASPSQIKPPSPAKRVLSTKERVLKAKADRIEKEQAERRRQLREANKNVMAELQHANARAKGEFEPTIVQDEAQEVPVPCGQQAGPLSLRAN